MLTRRENVDEDCQFTLAARFGYTFPLTGT
jgi:hypothetical protein